MSSPSRSSTPDLTFPPPMSSTPTSPSPSTTSSSSDDDDDDSSSVPDLTTNTEDLDDENDIPEFDNAHDFHCWLLKVFRYTVPSENIARARLQGVRRKYAQWIIPKNATSEWKGLFATIIDLMAADDEALEEENVCCETHRMIHGL